MILAVFYYCAHKVFDESPHWKNDWCCVRFDSAVQPLVITYSIVIALFSPYIPSVEFGEYASLKLFGFTRVYYLVCVAIFCIYGLCMWGIIMLTRFLVIDEYLVVLKFFWPLEL